MIRPHLACLRTLAIVRIVFGQEFNLQHNFPNLDQKTGKMMTGNYRTNKMVSLSSISINISRDKQSQFIPLEISVTNTLCLFPMAGPAGQSRYEALYSLFLKMERKSRYIFILLVCLEWGIEWCC